MTCGKSRWVMAAALAIGCAIAKADDFFTATATGSGGTWVFATSHNIIHLTDDLLTYQPPFAPLLGQNVSASLSWGGVPNAISTTENTAQTSATLTFHTTGFTETFVGTSSGDLEDQIRDFIKGDGAAYSGDFGRGYDNNGGEVQLVVTY